MKTQKFRNTVSVFLVAVCGLILTLTYFGFSPPYSEYLSLTHMAFHPDDFGADPVLSGSVYVRASIYYELIALLGLPITNDYLGLGLHYVLNGAILYLVYRIARDTFGIQDNPTAIALVIVLCLVSSTFVLGSLSGAITLKTPTPTGLAHIAGMASLLFAFQRKIALSALFCAICIAITPKGTILLVPALCLYTLLDRQISNRLLIWFALPAAYIAWRAAFTPAATMTGDEATQMIRLVFLREQEDGQFLDQPLLANIYFWISVAAFPFVARHCPDPGARKLGYALLLVTAGAVVFNLAYSFLYPHFPVPVLAMLSIPQATKFYLFVFALFVASAVLLSDRLYWHEKIALVLALVLLKPLPVQSAVALALVTFGVVLPRALQVAVTRLSGRDLLHDVYGLPQRVAGVPLVLGVLIGFFVVARSGDSYVAPSWIDTVSLKMSGNWSAAVWADEDAWDAWQALSARPDFPLLAIYRRSPPGRPAAFATHPAAYVTTRKSPFATLPAHAYLDIDLWYESQKRYEIRQQIIDRLNVGDVVDNEYVGTITIRKEGVPLSINEHRIDFLAKRNARLLVPKELARLFPGAKSGETVGAYVLLAF